MKTKKVPDDQVRKFPGIKSVIMVVEIQEGAQIDDYIAAIKKNGEEIDDIIYDDPDIGGKDPIDPDPIKPIDPDPISTEEDNQKEDDDEKEKRPLGKFAKRAAIVALAGLLLSGIATTKYVTEDTKIIPADKTHQAEIADIMLIEVDGEWVQYIGSVYDDPGQLLHDMRDAALGELLGTQNGRNYYDSYSTEALRVNQEEEILKVSDEFQKQQAIIKECEGILVSGTASTQQKKKALEDIITAKESIKQLYVENTEAYTEYAWMAKNAYARNGGDARTDQERAMIFASEIKYLNNIEELENDTVRMKSLIDTLNNPENLFEEQPAPKGTVENDYAIDFGKVKLGKIEETLVTDLDYIENVTLENGEVTETSGRVIINASAIEEIETTTKGIWAVYNIIKDAVNGKDIGDVYVLGNQHHDNSNIENER